MEIKKELYKVIITNEVCKGQVFTEIKEYKKLQDAEEFIEILKPYRFTNIKLIKEYLVQEVMKEWN